MLLLLVAGSTTAPVVDATCHVAWVKASQPPTQYSVEGVGEAGEAGRAGDAYSLLFAAGVLGAAVGAAAGVGSGSGVGAAGACAPPLVGPRYDDGLVRNAEAAVVAGAAVGAAPEVVPAAWVAADAGGGVAAAA